MPDLTKLKQRLEILWQEVERLEAEGGGGGGGTSDYTELSNKPSINSVELNGNKTLAQLGIASAASLSTLISQFDDLFAVDSVSVASDGEYPTTLDSRLALHQPINLNSVNYYFFEESGIDYNYFAIDTSGAYPMISLAQLLKENHRVVFYEYAVDTVPTDNSDNFITSGGVYTALASKADSSSVYTKTEIDSALGDKANSADVYTKTQVDTKVTALTNECGSLADRGAKNFANFDTWKRKCSIVRGTKTINANGSITITATSSDCYTLFSPTDFPVECRIPVTPGTEMVATWAEAETGTGNKYLYFFPDGSTSGAISVKASDGTKTFTVPAGCSYLTWRIGCSTSGDTLTINNLMVCTKADYDASNTYVPYAPTNRQLYVGQTGYTAESSDGSFSSLLHNAASYCGVDDSKEVNGFIVFTSSVTSENLIGFFNFKYTRNVVFSTVITNTITYSNQSQYGTVVVTGGTGPYKAVVKFI